MVAYDHGYFDPSHRPYYCVYTGRRHRLAYQHTLAEVHERYAGAIVMAETMPEVLAPAMGNDMITARFAGYDDTVSYTHLDVYKRQHYIIIPDNPKKFYGSETLILVKTCKL